MYTLKFSEIAMPFLCLKSERIVIPNASLRNIEYDVETILHVSELVPSNRKTRN